MLFNSFTFLLLALITFIVYYLPALSRFQVQLLIISSLVFYSYQVPVLVLLLLVSAGINIVVSYYVVFGKAHNKKALAALGVAINLLILAFFKYSPLFAHTFLDSSGSFGKFLLTIPLPIGISFFTFEGISLVVDLYKNNFYDQKEIEHLTFSRHAQRTLFFISFFPHLVAGPILKAHDFLPQIGVKKLADINWNECFKNLVLGYFLKMVVADNLKDFTFWIANPYYQGFSSITLLTMLFGYSCQIFADFAGYSLIAIGLGKIYGYNLQENFNFPYISTSFKEFWKRWHISLSTFLMQYLYIPLGGNRKGKGRTYLNLIITMFLGGLWHGAAWSYAIWGTFHGVALAIEKLFTGNSGSSGKNNKIYTCIKGISVFSLVTLGWLLFKLPDFNDVIGFFTSLWNNYSMSDNTRIISYILIYASPVIAYHLVYLLKVKSWMRLFFKFEYYSYGVMIFLLLVNSGMPGTFIYFQF